MSDDDGECIHGLGPIAACVLCNGRQAREDKAAREVVYRFPARFDGPMSCGHSVEVGDMIARTADGNLICEDCAP